MITPKELLEKAKRPFFKIVTSQLKGETVFPWVIPSNKKMTGSNFSDWKEDLVPLHQNSKEMKGFGYSIDWKQKLVNGSKQSMPARIYIESFEDYLLFVGKKQDFRKISEAKEVVTNEIPLLEEWAVNNPEKLLDFSAVCSDLMQVCQYMLKHPPPHNFYIREIPVQVHSKFIEEHSRIIRELLDIILPREWVDVKERDFAKRFGFKKPGIHTQIRVLDDALKPALGYDECSLPLDDAAWLQWLPEKVFIIENQICYLTFPKVKGAVAIFGEGFKSRISKHITWLENTELYCWFDLDAAGFEMLNMIRQYYPMAKSFLMDNPTFNAFESFSVDNKSKKKGLSHLQPDEEALYQFLTDNNKRLEQERIAQQYVLERLSV